MTDTKKIQLGENVTLYQGDCLGVMADMDDKSVDMIFTDPPYGHNNNNGDLISKWEAALGRGDYVPERDARPIANDGKEANEIFRSCLPEFKRILGDDGCCCCCCCGGGGPDPMFAKWSLYLDEVLNFMQMIVWGKGPMGMGWRYRRSYETVLVAYKGKKCRWFSSRNDIENIIRPSQGIRKIIPSAEQHPTEKPVELSTFFIQLHTLPGDTVFDPFAGSGTTGVACIRAGRKFIGIEIDPKYFEMARRRIEKELSQPYLFEAAERNASKKDDPYLIDIKGKLQ